MNVFSSIVDYLRSAKAELEKVSWPSKGDTLRYSGLVLSVSVVVAAFFASLDFGLLKIVDAALLAGNPTQVSAPAPETSAPAVTPTLEFASGTEQTVQLVAPSGTAQ